MLFLNSHHQNKGSIIPTAIILAGYIIIVIIALMIFASPALARVPVIPGRDGEESFINRIQEVTNVGAVHQIDANTSLETSLERFFFTLFNAFTQREENFLLSFELGKIEKAREDVNKLMYEAYRELNPEALQLQLGTEETKQILKSQGISTAAIDSATGLPVTIKLEGRIITNIDDFLEEEPIQKARDYVYCALAPWKHFPLDPEDADYCKDNNLTIGAEDEVICGGEPKTCEIIKRKRCNTENVCVLMAEEGKQCPSDKRRDEFKERLLMEIHRKHKFLDTAPPESWYTPDRCQLILEGLSCDQQEKSKCPLPKPGPELTKNYDLIQDEPTIDLAPSTDRVLSWNDYIQLASNPSNSPLALLEKIRQNAERIITEYRTNRQVQYIAGQGLRPEKYLIGFPDKTTAQKEEDKKKFGRELKGYTGQYFFFDTENVISPAVILQNKLAAATQAQFDLAQMAFKYPPDQSMASSEGVYNIIPEVVPVIKPSIAQLPPPWEDIQPYAQLNPLYKQIPQYNGDEISGGLPVDFKKLGINDYYLNIWYKDIFQMDRKPFSKLLKEWFTPFKSVTPSPSPPPPNQ